MTNRFQRIAISGFAFCIAYFILAIVILILSRTGIVMTQQHNIYSNEYLEWRNSTIGKALAIIQILLFSAIWVHIVLICLLLKEYYFISIAIVIHLIWSLYTGFVYNNFTPLGIMMIITATEALFLLISLWFVRNKHLRTIIRLYTAIVVAEFLTGHYLLPVLYDDFGILWTLINPIVMNLIPYIVLTILFSNIIVKVKYSSQTNTLTTTPKQ
jgi:hypothetical protein